MPANALSAPERAAVLGALRSARFVDAAPAQVWATLLDEGLYLASVSSMYRLLRAEGELRERRAQALHPPRARPELVAEGPNRVWSWDITKLKGPARGEWFALYVILDIFSRYVPGLDDRRRRVGRHRPGPARAGRGRPGHRPRPAGGARRPGQLDDQPPGG